MSTGEGSFTLRHDAYNTGKSVTVTVYIKDHVIEDFVPHPDNKSLTIELKCDGTEMIKAWVFPNEVVPSTLKIDQTKMKIEMTLQKAKQGMWEKSVLEEAASRPLYERWRNVQLPDEEEEKNEGLDQFLQKIYKDADPDARRAMMKSFTESGGTVLSTNWQDVGSRKVEPQPPKSD